MLCPAIWPIGTACILGPFFDAQLTIPRLPGVFPETEVNSRCLRFRYVFGGPPVKYLQKTAGVRLEAFLGYVLRVWHVWCQKHMSNEKNLGWLGYIGDEKLPSYIGHYFINHEIRIPINQPVFHGKYPAVFFSWLTWNYGTKWVNSWPLTFIPWSLEVTIFTFEKGQIKSTSQKGHVNAELPGNCSTLIRATKLRKYPCRPAHCSENTFSCWIRFLISLPKLEMKNSLKPGHKLIQQM